MARYRPTTPTSGWRLFAMAGQRLVSPLAAIGLLGDVPPGDCIWDTITKDAACLGARHRAPAAGCTCGIRVTVDLDRLLEHAQRTVPPEGRRLIDQAAVLALVDFDGAQVMPGTDIPHDDPQTTVRVSRATIRELHVADEDFITYLALSGAYKVPVHRWSGDQWPHGVRSLDEWFTERLRGMTLGGMDLTGDVSAVVSLAKDMVRRISARDLMKTDAASAVYQSPAKPTWEQSTAFVSAAIDVYAPAAHKLEDAFAVAPPVTQLDTWLRAMGIS